MAGTFRTMVILHPTILNRKGDMITGGKRMKSLLLSGKVKPDVSGQVLDIYNQSVMQGISPTIKTTIDKSIHSKRLFPTDGSPRS